MPVRSSMSDIIQKIRLMIGDTSGASQFFQDIDVQNACDDGNREDIRYEALTIAPSIVNNTLTNNQAQTIFADYYSRYSDWENNVILQGYQNGNAWVVLTPAAFEPLMGHWQFEVNVFTTGTSVPGQLPPVFATGSVVDIYGASADLLEFWAASFSAAYDISVDGQSLRRSQLMTAKLALAEYFRKRAKPKVGQMARRDVLPELGTRRIRLLDAGDSVRGG